MPEILSDAGSPLGVAPIDSAANCEGSLTGKLAVENLSVLISSLDTAAGGQTTQWNNGSSDGLKYTVSVAMPSASSALAPQQDTAQRIPLERPAGCIT
ncbi:hypothetical protein AAFF_G00082240 [Aldrovandia affinis]|uniref:Uncharacterized protein n=1 Tax=Aldrovandia affinis TaxID=143900 RepID=A0AAD7T3H7_9TELE|nr:hypothetical protein AAFF_G00082240 [Aldrovandia affinis]